LRFVRVPAHEAGFSSDEGPPVSAGFFVIRGLRMTATSQINIRFRVDRFERFMRMLRLAAKAENKSLQQLCRDLLEEGLERRAKAGPGRIIHSDL
jgi:hypothetical protein